MKFARRVDRSVLPFRVYDITEPGLVVCGDECRKDRSIPQDFTMTTIQQQVVLPAWSFDVMALNSYLQMTSDWEVEVCNDSRAGPQSLYLLLTGFLSSFAFHIFGNCKVKVIIP